MCVLLSQSNGPTLIMNININVININVKQLGLYLLGNKELL